MTDPHAIPPLHGWTGEYPAGEDDARGDPRTAAIERLFREHNQSLLRFLMTKLRSPQEARDVAQEAYVRLLQLDNPDAVSYLRAFLFKTAANLAIDRLRSRRAESRRLEMEFFAEPPAAPDPQHDLADAEALRVIEESLQRLPPKCRQAFLLRRFDGLRSAEIARRMHIPERTVRHYIEEAIVYCRSQLDRFAPREDRE
jgi:RNA polymerase sigma-70 factor (ECF subfamily)